MTKRVVLLSVLTAGLVLPGCNIAKFITYVFAPSSRTRTVKAECPELAGSRVAVLVFTDVGTDFEYPDARARLSERIANELMEKVDGIEVVPPREVLEYQREHRYWDAEDKTELGKRFDAEYVLFVSMIEYSLQEPGSTTLCRGVISGEASVYESSAPESASRVWSSDKISVAHPENAVVGMLSEEVRRIRNEAERQFVGKLAKKFYKHEQEIAP